MPKCFLNSLQEKEEIINMLLQELISKLDSLEIPQSGYRLFLLENERFYFGKSASDKVVFVIESNNNKLRSFSQETKNLAFYFNLKAHFLIDETNEIKTVHLLECKGNEKEIVEAFLRLTQAFALNNYSDDQYYLTKLFTILVSLFAKEKGSPETELQGLYAELYAILYLNERGCDISSFWQSKDRMKFDFSINGKKRIEVKSTIKPNRIHRFRHEQLLSDLYDIRVISVMLQKNDRGLSLKEIINITVNKFCNDLPLIFHIEQLIRKVDECQLSEMKYDEVYTNNNIRFYKAEDIPHFEENNPDGVSNAEYDCDLSGCQSISVEDLKSFIYQ